MIRLPLILLLFAASAMGGTVRTITGQTLSGTVTIDSSGHLVVNVPDSGPVRVNPDDVLEATFSQEPHPPPLREGVVLTNGTAIAAPILRVDQTTLIYQRNNNQIAVPLAHVAQIILDPAAADLLSKVPTGQTGVLLASGDFVQGDLQGIDQGQVNLTSVVFGINSYAIGKEAVAVIVAPIQPAKCNWVVEMADGSVLMASTLKIAEGELVAQDLTQGTFVASEIGLYAYRIGPGRQTSLLDLSPDQPSNANVPAELSGIRCNEAISMGGGSSATFHLDAKFKAFTCRVGVSSRVAPTATVTFVILGDGIELRRTNGRTSVDEPISMAVPVAGVRDLVLKVEATVNGDLGAAGVWDQPYLIRQ